MNLYLKVVPDPHCRKHIRNSKYTLTAPPAQRQRHGRQNVFSRLLGTSLRSSKTFQDRQHAACKLCQGNTLVGVARAHRRHSTAAKHSLSHLTRQERLQREIGADNSEAIVVQAANLHYHNTLFSKAQVPRLYKAGVSKMCQEA